MSDFRHKIFKSLKSDIWNLSSKKCFSHAQQTNPGSVFNKDLCKKTIKNENFSMRRCFFIVKEALLSRLKRIKYCKEYYYEKNMAKG